jgi:hypothetical protein
VACRVYALKKYKTAWHAATSNCIESNMVTVAKSVLSVRDVKGRFSPDLLYVQSHLLNITLFQKDSLNFIKIFFINT